MLPIVFAAIFTAWLILFGAYWKPLLRLWREPVLRAPVFIIESDDWGPGPAEHAQALTRLASILCRFVDRRGRHPVTTLGLVLSAPDTGRTIGANFNQLHRLMLSDPRFREVRRSIALGVERGVFAPQLHGLEHYWPPALLAAARTDPAVKSWLSQKEIPASEDLPPSLQSRWTDARTLPSQPIHSDLVRHAVAEEVSAFEAYLGRRPAVVVPPTFVWNETAEAAWAAAEVEVLVTPGRRNSGRDATGGLISDGGPVLNCERGVGGLTYLVRDVYFEPALGHSSAQALSAIERKNDLGRPALIETHRFNFVGNTAKTESSFRALESVLEAVLRRFPDTRFMSCEELARLLVGGSADIVERRLLRRYACWLARTRTMPRFWKLALLTGVAIPLWLLTLVVPNRAATYSPENRKGSNTPA